MSNTLQQPVTPDEHAQVDYGQHLIWRLVGATISGFGANELGEIYLSAITKTGESVEVIMGTDESGGVALFEVERSAPVAAPVPFEEEDSHGL